MHQILLLCILLRGLTSTTCTHKSECPLKISAAQVCVQQTAPVSRSLQCEAKVFGVPDDFLSSLKEHNKGCDVIMGDKPVSPVQLSALKVELHPYFPLEPFKLHLGH